MDLIRLHIYKNYNTNRNTIAYKNINNFDNYTYELACDDINTLNDIIDTYQNNKTTEMKNNKDISK